MRKFLILMSLAGGLLACEDGATDGSQEGEVLQQAAAAAKPLIEKAGAACAVDADCKGTGTRCLTSSSLSGVTYPGGYCTVACTADSDCNEGAACPLATVDAGVFPSPEVQKAVTVCLPKCKADADCREGYTCSTKSSLSFIDTSANTQGYCQPKPAADAGTAAAKK